MALAMTNLTAAFTGTPSAAAWFTNSISPAAGAVLLLALSSDNTNPAPSGGGVSSDGWVHIANTATGAVGIRLYRALSAAGSGNIAFGTIINHNTFWSVDQITGCNLAGNAGSGAIIQANTSNTTPGSTSPFVVTLNTFANSSNIGYGWTRMQGISGMLAGSGFTLLGDLTASSAYSEYKINSSAINFAFTGTSTLSIGIGVEISVPKQRKVVLVS